MEVSSTTLRGAMEASSPTQQPRGAIAYLAQGVRHSTYGRDSLALLRRSLSLLYENYAQADAADSNGVWNPNGYDDHRAHKEPHHQIIYLQMAYQLINVLCLN